MTFRLRDVGKMQWQLGDDQIEGCGLATQKGGEEWLSVDPEIR
jgi:hypothetical protein